MNNWFKSTLEIVREKSLDAIEFVRKDLSDFTITVKNDTENYLNKITSQCVGDFGINRHTKTLENDYGQQLMTSTSFDRFHNERVRLQNDESTYLIDPIPIETYENWRKTNNFNVDMYKDEIAQLLIDAPHVRSIYARLVPVCTTHNDFWCRYYFNLYQLNEDETKRINLLKRAHEICNETHGNDWEDLDDGESTKKTSNVNQQLLIISERKENDTGDSWEPEFDETDLPKCQMNDSILRNKADNEFDDEWESWS